MSKVTIYTLAKELNMTPSMISRAFSPNGKISEEKRKIVLETAKKYNFTPNKFASRLSMKTVRIGILISSRFAVNTDKMILGIENAYANLKDYKVQYDIKIMKPYEDSLNDYVEVLDKYKHYDGVILTGMSSQMYTDMIKDLCKENSNVVQVQAVNKNINCLFVSKHNEEVASELAAEFLYNCMRGSVRKNVILFTGDRESVLHSDAEVAFKKACKEFGFFLLESVDMKDDEEYFAEILPEIFNRYNNEIDGIYMTSGLSMQLCRHLDENNIKVPFVCFDTYKEIKEYLKKGVVSAAIAQKVEEQMEVAFEYLVKHIIAGYSCPKIIYTDIQLVLKSNMHQFE